LSQSYDEIKVFGGVAERTGQIADRQSVRGRRNVCRSLTELSAKTRRTGDGFYYLAASCWPENTTEVDLNQQWQCIA
jgi:hypothetical protein